MTSTLKGKKKEMCQFCGDREVTKERFRPTPDYPMAYDLCDECADTHKKVWLRMKGKS